MTVHLAFLLLNAGVLGEEGWIWKVSIVCNIQLVDYWRENERWDGNMDEMRTRLRFTYEFQCYGTGSGTDR